MQDELETGSLDDEDGADDDDKDDAAAVRGAVLASRR